MNKLDIGQYRRIIQPEPDSQDDLDLRSLATLYDLIEANEKDINDWNDQRRELSQFDAHGQNRIDSNTRELELENRDMAAEASQLESRLRKVYKHARLERQAANIMQLATG